MRIEAAKHSGVGLLARDVTAPSISGIHTSSVQLKILPFLPDTRAHGLPLVSLMEAKASRHDKTYSYRR